MKLNPKHIWPLFDVCLTQERTKRKEVGKRNTWNLYDWCCSICLSIIIKVIWFNTCLCVCVYVCVWCEHAFLCYQFKSFFSTSLIIIEYFPQKCREKEKKISRQHLSTNSIAITIVHHLFLKISLFSFMWLLFKIMSFYDCLT